MSTPSEPKPATQDPKQAAEHVTSAHQLLKELQEKVGTHPELGEAITKLEMALAPWQSKLVGCCRERIIAYPHTTGTDESQVRLNRSSSKLIVDKNGRPSRCTPLDRDFLPIRPVDKTIVAQRDQRRDFR